MQQLTNTFKSQIFVTLTIWTTKTIYEKLLKEVRKSLNGCKIVDSSGWTNAVFENLNFTDTSEDMRKKF